MKKESKCWKKKIMTGMSYALLVSVLLGGCGKSGGSSKTDTSVIADDNTVGSAEAGAEMTEELSDSGVSWDYQTNASSSMTEGTKKYDAVGIEEMEEGQREAEYNTEEYNALEETGFADAAATPLSTFSADVDTASYSNLRRMISYNYRLEEIPKGAVRIEELLNYFDYDYRLPEGDEPFGVTAQMGICPWNEEHRLLAIGLKTQEIDFSESTSSNLVFLLDVSGSMGEPDKLPLLQRAFGELVENLTEKDRISIVTYAGKASVLLQGTKGSEKELIQETLLSLEAGGSTNGSQGIEMAYELAEEYFIEGGSNRIILATDGDLNIGQTSESELTELVKEKRENGVYMTVLGFGTGNIKDNKMEALADNGNGNYAYIDSVSEAKKVLVEEMGATLVTVAKDVKLQVEFNPEKVKEYRLIGYENRRLAAQDFEDDTKDAGEIGAGHTVTALYEIVPMKEGEELHQSLKYSDVVTTGSEEWLTVNIRYKEPEGEESILLQYPVGEEAYTENPSEDWRFAATVAEFGLIVTDSSFKGEADLQHVKKSLKELECVEEDEYKEEFYDLVKKLIKNG